MCNQTSSQFTSRCTDELRCWLLLLLGCSAVGSCISCAWHAGGRRGDLGQVCSNCVARLLPGNQLQQFIRPYGNLLGCLWGTSLDSWLQRIAVPSIVWPAVKACRKEAEGRPLCIFKTCRTTIPNMHHQNQRFQTPFFKFFFHPNSFQLPLDFSI